MFVWYKGVCQTEYAFQKRSRIKKGGAGLDYRERCKFSRESCGCVQDR